jgi:hypothetical protein
MNEQHGDVPPRTASAPADTSKNPPALRPTNQFPAEISHATKVQPMSAELDAIQNKLNRLLGKPEWNDKQWTSFFTLVEERDSLMGRPDWREEIREVIKTLKGDPNVGT